MDECSICIESLNKTTTLLCGHIFHSNCINQWITYNKKCPLCRDQISYSPDGGVKTGYIFQIKCLETKLFKKQVSYEKEMTLMRNKYLKEESRNTSLNIKVRDSEEQELEIRKLGCHIGRLENIIKSEEFALCTTNCEKYIIEKELELKKIYDNKVINVDRMQEVYKYYFSTIKEYTDNNINNGDNKYIDNYNIYLFDSLKMGYGLNNISSMIQHIKQLKDNEQRLKESRQPLKNLEGSIFNFF